MKLEGKIALITGASSGMGNATARLFAHEGATVLAVARRLERLETLATESPNVVPLACDVSDETATLKLIADAFAKYGRIDILVNNAGIMDDMMPAAECSDELWDSVMQVNLKAPFYITRAWLNGMLAQGGGVIVNVASVGGLNGSRAGAAYTASKFGVIGLTKNTAFMYAGQGVRCNAIAPGAVDTEIGSTMKNVSQFGASRAMAGLGLNPRTGSAEEIAKVALFLACDDSSFVNGVVLTADAGWTAY